jgi:hypothetical protein
MLLGSEHKCTLLSLLWLGWTLAAYRKLYEMRETLKFALEGQERIPGKDHDHNQTYVDCQRHVLVSMAWNLN